MADKLTVILCQARGAGELERTRQQQMAEALATRPDIELAVLPHLYDLAPDGAGVQWLRSVQGNMAVLAWLNPRASYWVLRANGVEGRMGRTSFFPVEEIEPPPGAGPDRVLWCLDLRGPQDPSLWLGEIEGLVRQTVGPPGTMPEASGAIASAAPTCVEEPVLPRWYPVIDYLRCENCLECLNFCLFGVYGLDDEGRILVEQPDACRDGCPACSRICPQAAVLFPHHAEGSISGDQLAAGRDSVDALPCAAGTGPGATADAERRRAMAQQQSGEAAANPAPPAQDGLDRLVDELENSDL